MLTYPIGALRPKVDIIPRDNLLLEWLLQGNANDTSGNGFDGTVDGAVLTADNNSVPNQAYLFDGVNDRIFRAHNAGMYNSQISISTWVRIDSLHAVNNNNWISAGWATTPTSIDGVYVYKPSGNKIQFIYFKTGSIVVVMESSVTFTLGVWFHVLCAHSNVSYGDRIYINGVRDLGVTYRIGAYGAMLTTGTPDMYLGARSNNTEFTNGAICKYRRYSDTLTQAEITALANE